MANVEKLKKVLAHIQEHPETWEQSTWLSRVLEPKAMKAFMDGSLLVEEEGLDGVTCGTAGCFAGWTCLLEGWKPVLYSDRIHADRVRSPEGETRDVGDAAQRILGLTMQQRTRLFDADNSFVDLCDAVERIEEEEKEEERVERMVREAKERLEGRE